MHAAPTFLQHGPSCLIAKYGRVLSSLAAIVRLLQSTIRVQGLSNRTFATKRLSANSKSVLMLLGMDPEATVH